MSLFDSFSLTVYNALLTAGPSVTYAFEKDVKEKSAIQVHNNTSAAMKDFKNVTLTRSKTSFFLLFFVTTGTSIIYGKSRRL